MVYWNRFISYIYRYHDGHKCENVGFAKVSKTGRTGRISVGLRNGMRNREEMYDVYIYRETLPTERPITSGGSPESVMIPVPVYVGSMGLKNGRGEHCFSFCWDNVSGSGRPVTAFAGVIIFLHGTDPGSAPQFYESDMFCSSWTDSVVDYQAARFCQKSEDVADDAEEEVSSTEVDEEYAEQVRLPETAKCDSAVLSETVAAVNSMLEEREKLPLLPGSCMDDGNDGVIESVKITPNDIGLLDMCNWKLGVNSFLTHGYYSYKYLMLGKVVFSPDRRTAGYILGVPGVYSSREKYLADIFGFDRFVPEKETQVKPGSFGYWIVDIR